MTGVRAGHDPSRAGERGAQGARVGEVGETGVRPRPPRDRDHAVASCREGSADRDAGPAGRADDVDRVSHAAARRASRPFRLGRHGSRLAEAGLVADACASALQLCRPSPSRPILSITPLPAEMSCEDRAAMPDEDSAKFLLLYGEPLAINADAVIQAMRHFHPNDCADAGVVRSGASAADFQQFRVGDRTISVDVKPKPLPEETWLGAAQQCNWAKAVEVCSGHRAHAVVSVDGRPAGTLADARLNAAVAGSIAVAHGNAPVAAIWVDGIAILNEGKKFRELAIMAFKRAPSAPFALWVDMLSFTAHDTQTAVIFTVGLGRFGHLELEFEAPVQHQKLLWEQCRNVIGYLIEHEGEMLQHGATFAIPRVVSYVVQKKASQRFGGVGVYAAKLDVKS